MQGERRIERMRKRCKEIRRGESETGEKKRGAQKRWRGENEMGEKKRGWGRDGEERVRQERRKWEGRE